MSAARTGDARSGLARALSKLGFCSRSQAWKLVEAGRVQVNDAIQRDPEARVNFQRDRIRVDGEPVRAGAKVYFMLNKPRGLVTTARDERGRATVFDCFVGQALPFVSPVGRLDQASEGLLLFTNDGGWAARITDPSSHLDKTYHVQIDCVADEGLLERMVSGVVSEGERLAAKSVRWLRHGEKNSWVEVVLDEGRNRHVRRMLAALGLETLRLVRVAIGPLELGSLAKGQFRRLTPAEVSALSRGGPAAGKRRSG